MSQVKAFWFFAQKINRSIFAPVGTLEKIMEHVEWVEDKLDIEREKYLDNPERWKHTNYENIEEKTLCRVAIEHNNWQRQLFEDFGKWSENQPGEGMEEITPVDAEKFFPALTTIEVPLSRWSRDYYIGRMQVYYETMRGREAEGMKLSGEPLTTEQANAVIWLFSHILDEHDVRLDVPKGCDSLYASDDGGYEWCEKCGAILPDDVYWCKENTCPLAEESDDEE